MLQMIVQSTWFIDWYCNNLNRKENGPNKVYGADKEDRSTPPTRCVWFLVLGLSGTASHELESACHPLPDEHRLARGVTATRCDREIFFLAKRLRSKLESHLFFTVRSFEKTSTNNPYLPVKSSIGPNSVKTN